ncbi:MAG: polar amino acid transport system substrate-binding protein [Enterobacterales bacterium]|jgi:polar amino acid transport system substrate-binding protein
MQIIRLITLVIVLGILSTATAVENKPSLSDVVIITADNWCPYTCKDSDVHKGLIVDVVKAAFNEVELTAKYEYRVSWTRAKQNVTFGLADVILAADEENTKEVILAKNFYFYDETIFAVLKKNNILLNETKDLLNYKIGVLEDYGYDDGGIWEVHIEGHPNSTKISASQGEPHLLNLLVRNRIEIAILNWDVAKNAVLSNPKLANIEMIRKNVLSKLTIGFTRSKRGEHYRKMFNKGFDQLIQTNKLTTIYNKYAIELPNFTSK